MKIFILTLASVLVLASEPKKLVIIGDSITEGYGVGRAQAYPSLLQDKISKTGKDWMVINSGISGSTAASAPSRVTWALKQKPALMILALGANDGLRGTPVKNIEENLSSALEACKQSAVKVVLVGMKMPPNYGAAYSKEFAALYPRLAQKFGVPLIPFLLENVAGISGLNQGDGIHPNEKGHAIVATTVFKGIEKYL